MQWCGLKCLRTACSAKKIVIGGLASGLAIFLVSWIVNFVVVAALPYDVLSLGGMRAAQDPIMLLWFLHPWVIGFAMAIAFAKFKDSFKVTGWCRGKSFGLFVWLLTGLPSAFIVYTSMNYPIGFTVNSLLGSLLYMVAAGITLEKTMG